MPIWPGIAIVVGGEIGARLHDGEHAAHLDRTELSDVETVEQSRELLRQMDELLAKSPLQPVARS